MKRILAFKWVSIMLVVLIVAAAIGCGNKEAQKVTPTPTATQTATATVQPTGETGTLSSLEGDVQVLRSGASNWIVAISGMRIGTGDGLKTGEDGYVLITFFDGSVMEVEAGSEISVEELSKTSGGSTTVHINQVIGNTINRVENLVDSSSSYEVETAAGSAVVRGTAFEMRVDQYGELSHSCVSTLKGNDGKTHSVDFSGGGVAVNVPEGMTSCCWEGGVPGHPFYTDPADDPLAFSGDGGGGGGQGRNACDLTNWHTFYGSADDDRGLAVALDGGGNIYVTGRSNDTWNGSAGQLPLHAHSDPGTAADVFILKLNCSGGYQWHTFYGTNGSENHVDYGYGIAVDESNIYVTGFSCDSWNGPEGQLPDHAFSGDYKDAFVLKLNSSGGYQWHTFYGSADYEDEGHGIALDATGNICIAVKSYDTWNGSSGEPPLHGYSEGLNAGSQTDIAVLKLDCSDGHYVWHTFYGSTEYNGEDNPGEEPTSVVTDSNSNIYVGGFCIGSWNGSEGQLPLHDFTGGNNDACVLKLNSSGGYKWHTIYGSNDNDWANGLAQRNGYIYTAGFSGASWDGPEAQSSLHSYSGGHDIMVLALNSSGGYQWHTFYGSSGEKDYGRSIGVDGSSNVYVTGRSYASWQGDGNHNPLHTYSGGSDITILKLNNSGGYQWHTFYGSAGADDFGHSIAVRAVDAFYVAGYSSASWLRDGDAGPLHAYTGSNDIYVLYKVP